MDNDNQKPDQSGQQESLAAIQRAFRAMSVEQQPDTFDLVIGGIPAGNPVVESRRVFVDLIHNSSNNTIELQLDDGSLAQKFHHTFSPQEVLPMHGLPFHSGMRVAVFNVTGNDTTYNNFITIAGRLKKL